MKPEPLDEDSTVVPGEDDSVTRLVFDALDAEAGVGGRPVAAGSAATHSAGKSADALEDSFRAEAGEVLAADDDTAESDDFDDLDDLDDELSAPVEIGRPAGPAAARGLRGFFSLAGGALLAVVAALLIVMWGFGRDPFGLSLRLPERLAFLLPPEFRGADERQSISVEDFRGPTEDARGIGN